MEADRRLTSDQAVCALRHQVQEAGHPANFVQPQAMAEIIHRSSGVASDLSMLTGLSLFVARLAEAPQITLAHVEQAVRIKNGTDLGGEPDFDDDGVALAAAPTATVARPAVTKVSEPHISKIVSPRPGSRRGVGLGSVVAVAVAALGIGVAGGWLLTSHRLVHGSGPVTADAPVPAVPTATADAGVTAAIGPEPPPPGAFVPTIATPPVPALIEDPALPSATVSPALAATPAPVSPAPVLPAPVLPAPVLAPSLPDPAPQAGTAPVPSAPLPPYRASSEPSPTPGQPPREQALPGPAAQPVPAVAALPHPDPAAAVAPDPPPAAPVEAASSAPADVPAPRRSEPSSPDPPAPAPAVAAVEPPAPATVPSAPNDVLAAAAAVVAQAAARPAALREAPPAAVPSPEAEPPLPPATPVHIMLVYDPLMPQADTRAALLAAILRDHGYEVPPALPSASRGEPALSYVFAQDRPSAATIAQVLGLQAAQVHAAASPEPGLIRIAVVPPGPRSAAPNQQRMKRNRR